MEKNYYDILEVNKNASPEIIEKAYKTLVKKYHPDLQDNNLKAEYEEKIKLINEAFEVLSDSEKRKNYDLNLKQTEFSVEAYNNLINENLKLKNEINYLKNNLINYKNNINNNINNNFNSKINENLNYNDINKNNLNNNKNINNNYSENIRQKYNINSILENVFALFLTVFIFIFIFFILFCIPYTRNFLINFFNFSYFKHIL